MLQENNELKKICAVHIWAIDSGLVHLGYERIY